MKKGFYSPYFIVPKKGGGLQPILDLRVLNQALHRLPFKMLMQKCILASVRHQDCFAAVDLKDTFFHFSFLSRHRPFLWFAFEGQAYQYKVLPFGLSLSPLVFMKVAEAALAPLREVGIRILNYLNDWLILAHSRDMLCSHRDLVLSHLSRLGLRVNWEKSKLLPVQSISFLGLELDSVSLTVRLTNERTQSVLACLKAFKQKTAVPLKLFQRLLGLMASSVVATPLGLMHMRLLQHWLQTRVPRWAWCHGTHRVLITLVCHHLFSPWTDLSFLRAGVPLELVSRYAVSRRTPPKQAGAKFAMGTRLHWQINCLELLAILLTLQRFWPLIQGKHVLVRTDNTAMVAYVNRQGGLHSRCMSQLTRRLLLWRQQHSRCEPLTSQATSILQRTHCHGRLPSGESGDSTLRWSS
ncbi:uncharacterized protein LOC127439454 isoform X1 [Myxocyprinus asiaticus]|uniref:uncharacterized protein LOC127439454 isoform X1 n=1 Tax=Myxocyprinus asiaticus TaxID=70543 RepID=UPI00222393DA|nr:uncharacterized protein LOC127439454 isoform X1 [Myxocyprinus asiaticus]XP_051551622.1 uncharacterized protein LOC127439454 isoform X1 [Myxocyprinus asiaticus]XP_051551623.1 uncharacterized protein LOC127439454 isoform X1 [Myxocyprinus asiaticus]XP_051551624.1 uncharacterized protein LOC127439454 isoform X1 [Myxocyprinus asiaticus]XP_051551625.1 uncharacterized protein LOC127439454 isoform X1 [Myxocyprinus asiaticus]